MSELGNLLPSKSYEAYRLDALDWEPACELRSCQSDNPAATHLYVMRSDCHPFDKLACPDCAERVRAQIQRAESGVIRGWKCPVCSERIDYTPGLMSVQPIS